MAVQAREVHVWHGAVEQRYGGPTGPLAGDLADLQETERARCLTFGAPAAQRRFAAVHAGVRRVLAAYLATAAPLIRLDRRPCCQCGDTGHGPPRVSWPDTDVMFSLSHAGGHWLLAVARERPVGVDIEIAQNIDTGLLAAAALSPTERAYLRARPRADRDEFFYQCWTRKEAVLKACGVGLAGVPGSVEVAPMRRPRARVHLACPAGHREWLVEDLPSWPAAAGRPEPGGLDRWFGAVAQPLAGSGQIVRREVQPWD